MRSIPRSTALFLAFALAACGGDGPTNGGGGGGNNNPGPPAAVAVVSGAGQQVPAGQPAPAPLVVKVTDVQGRAVPSATVTFTVAAGSGSVSAASAATGADGLAQVAWTVGPSAGTHSVGAAVGTLAATFTATVTPNATVTGAVTFLDSLVASGLSLPGASSATLFRGSPKAASFLGRATAGGAQRQPARPVDVPGALIVTLRRESVGAPAGGPRARMGRQQAGAVADRMRRTLEEHAGPGRRVRDVSPQLAAARLEVQPGTEDAVAAELRRDPRVQRVDRDGWAYATAGVTPNDPFATAQAWHYALVDMPRAWKRTTGGADVLVAVVDDGIRFDHPDIAANLTADGYDFVSSINANSPCGVVNNAGDGGGYDTDPTIPADYNGCNLSPAGGHGLHVAGTIGGVGNNGLGMSGVAWNVRIRPVRVLGRLGGTNFDIAQGILYAAGLPASNGAGGVVQAASGARIINLSLGGPNDSPVMRNAVVAAVGTGALVVVAAGNDNTSAPAYPAAYPEVLTVSAVGPNRTRAGYSNWGPNVDIAAPGGDQNAGGYWAGVASTQWDFTTGRPTYNLIHGTSMAAPHVAGAAALLLAQDPSLTAVQLRERLMTYAVDLGAPGPDPVFGAGLLNVRNSLVQSHTIQSRLFGRVYDAATGAIVRDVAADGAGFSIGQLPDGAYHVFAGLDDEQDGIFGVTHGRWGGFTGLGGTLQPLAIQGAGTYPAAFSIGFANEREPNDTPATASRLMLGGSLYGQLNTASSVDVYTVTLPAGNYVFETVAWEGACGLTINADTELTLRSPAGVVLAQNDDINADRINYCSRIAQTVLAGTHTLTVSGFSAGGYRVIVRPA
ncbi:MAG TPA: S8 family serine peptidase [Longimicrobium sp.]|nr:S8 family serine peptidase [Longimicrobium sp.]